MEHFEKRQNLIYVLQGFFAIPQTIILKFLKNNLIKPFSTGVL